MGYTSMRPNDLPSRTAMARSLESDGGTSARPPGPSRRTDTPAKAPMSSLLLDLRSALRTLRRSPGFAVVSVVTLALGIGSSTAVFTVLHGVVLAPLPYPDADRLVRLSNVVPGVAPDEEWQLSTAQYFFLRAEAKTLDEVGVFQRGNASLAGEDETLRARLGMVDGGTLRLLGARSGAGRLFDEADLALDGPPVAVLDHGFWERAFGGDPRMVGRTIVLNDAPYEVVGVMAPGVRLPGEAGAPPLAQDVWLPYRLDPAGPFQNSHFIPTLARLRPESTIDGVQAELDRLTARLPDAYPQVYGDDWMERLGFGTVASPLKEAVIGDIARTLWLVFSAVGLVLFIAGTNVGNLLLVRLEARRRELAVRTAMGARTGDLARHLVVEAFVLSLLGTAFALPLGFGGVRWLLAQAPDTLPRLESVTMGPTALGFALLLTLVVALALAALGLFHANRLPGAPSLAEESRGRSLGRAPQRLRGGLVASQMAIALVLVVTAALLLESFQRLRAVDPGFAPESTLVVRAQFPPSRYSDFGGGQPAVWRLTQTVLERIHALPGVTAAGLAGELPLSGDYGCWGQTFEDPGVVERIRGGGGATCAALVPTSPGYFEALGIPLLAGRSFVDADNDSPDGGSVVVSRAFADRFWPGEDPIGKGVQPFGGNMPYYRVVGVVGDVAAGALDGPPALAIYYPIVPIPETASWMQATGHLVVRADRGAPIDLMPQLRAIFREADPIVALFGAEEMAAVLDRAASGVSFALLLLGVSAAAALVLAAVGLYGVISFLVTRRTPEIGVRMALGARPRQVERGVISGSLRLVALGLALGTLAALASTRLAAGLLYEVEPVQARAYVMSAAILTAVALLASWIPARRAARVDPMVALRAE